MDHAEATAHHAVDRYLLGELSAAEADAFEEHYFDCAECADELRVGMRFMNGGRGVAREEAAPEGTKVVRIDERRSRRTAWLPAAVAAALVLAVGAPMLMREPATTTTPQLAIANRVWVVPGQTRSSGSTPVQTVDRNVPTVVSFQIEQEYSRYEARLRRPDGSVLTTPFAPDPGDATSLIVHDLTPGSHKLEVVGIDTSGRANEIATIEFTAR